MSRYLYSFWLKSKVFAGQFVLLWFRNSLTRGNASLRSRWVSRPSRHALEAFQIPKVRRKSRKQFSQWKLVWPSWKRIMMMYQWRLSKRRSGRRWKARSAGAKAPIAHCGGRLISFLKRSPAFSGLLVQIARNVRLSRGHLTHGTRSDERNEDWRWSTWGAVRGDRARTYICFVSRKWVSQPWKVDVINMCMHALQHPLQNAGLLGPLVGGPQL